MLCRASTQRGGAPAESSGMSLPLLAGDRRELVTDLARPAELQWHLCIWQYHKQFCSTCAKWQVSYMWSACAQNVQVIWAWHAYAHAPVTPILDLSPGHKADLYLLGMSFWLSRLIYIRLRNQGLNWFDLHLLLVYWWQNLVHNLCSKSCKVMGSEDMECPACFNCSYTYWAQWQPIIQHCSLSRGS